MLAYLVNHLDCGPRLPAMQIIYDPREHSGEAEETVCERLEAEERARTGRHDNMLNSRHRCLASRQCLAGGTENTAFPCTINASRNPMRPTLCLAARCEDGRQPDPITCMCSTR